VLLYAYQPRAELHRRCRAWVEEAFSGEEPVRLAWVTVLAFIRISTSPRIFRAAAPRGGGDRRGFVLARASVGVPSSRRGSGAGRSSGSCWWRRRSRAPSSWTPSWRHWRSKNGATLVTTDRDFTRFPNLKLRNPAAGSGREARHAQCGCVADDWSLEGASAVLESDPGLSVFLGLLVLVLFVLPPLVDPEGGGRGLVLDVGLSLLLLAGVAALSTHSAVRALLFRAGGRALVVALGPVLSPATALAAPRHGDGDGVRGAGRRPFAQGPFNVHRIQGAVAAYLLLGLAWALAYESVALLATEAFSGPGVAAPERGRFIYFSFVTLTTVGYGDVTPVHPWRARWPSRKPSRGSCTRPYCSPASSPWRPAAGPRARGRRHPGPGRARSAGVAVYGFIEAMYSSNILVTPSVLGEDGGALALNLAAVGLEGRDGAGV